MIDVHRLAEAIYAADPPEVWIRTSTAAYLERARAIVVQYDPSEDLAGHRIKEPHDCFLMNCRDLGEEVESLQKRLASAEPTVIEPDQEPDDDTEAELPDVREDPVSDDPA